jgi:hypothetical protein
MCLTARRERLAQDFGRGQYSRTAVLPTTKILCELA